MDDAIHGIPVLRMTSSEVHHDQRLTAPPSWEAIGAVTALFFMSMTMCACGHMHWATLPFTLSATALSWTAFARPARFTLRRCVLIGLTALATMALLSNVADVLWLGHDPLFPNVLAPRTNTATVR
ncbi:MAG: hypothetical protein QM811_25595 [Pirellulales bacterium]